jgi:hypothetical protein
MTDRDRPNDELLDRNLRLIGERLSLPAAPTAFQRAAWKSASHSGVFAAVPGKARLLQKGVRFMKAHKTLTAAGSAVAATIAIAAMMLLPALQKDVEAAVIFESFRQTLNNALEITIRDVGAEGIRVNGKIIALRGGTEQEEALAEGVSGTCYIDVSVKADETADDVANMDVDVVLSITPEDQWVYLKMRQLPQEVVSEEPIAAAILGGLTRNGLLLDLTGILKQSEMNEIVDEINDAFEEIREAGVEVSAALQSSEEGEEKDAKEAELERIVAGLLTGEATGADIDSLVTLLETHAKNISVKEVRRGEYVLKASGFTFEEELDEEEMALVGNIALEIHYLEGSGVTEADVLHIGPYDGSISLRTTDVTVDDEMFNKERYLSEGVQYLDLSGIMEMAEQLGNQHVKIEIDAD